MRCENKSFLQNDPGFLQEITSTAVEVRLIYGSSIPAESTETAITPQTPSSIIVAVGIQPPTREEVAEGISELSDAAGNALRTDDPFRAQLPTVIVEKFSVEHIDIKGDHGW